MSLPVSRFVIEWIDALRDFDSKWICTNGHNPWVPNMITEAWAAERIPLNLQGWHFHDLRHLAAAGCGVLVIAPVLGHQTPDMSQLYTSVSDSRRATAVDKRGQLFTRHIVRGSQLTPTDPAF